MRCITPLPASPSPRPRKSNFCKRDGSCGVASFSPVRIIPEWSSSSFKSDRMRSEEHTSELQSRFDLVCRLLLEKKKKKRKSVEKYKSYKVWRISQS